MDATTQTRTALQNNEGLMPADLPIQLRKRFASARNRFKIFLIGK
jgi:hypothetical protein